MVQWQWLQVFLISFDFSRPFSMPYWFSWLIYRRLISRKKDQLSAFYLFILCRFFDGVLKYDKTKFNVASWYYVKGDISQIAVHINFRLAIIGVDYMKNAFTLNLDTRGLKSIIDYKYNLKNKNIIYVNLLFSILEIPLFFNLSFNIITSLYILFV